MKKRLSIVISVCFSLLFSSFVSNLHCMEEGGPSGMPGSASYVPPVESDSDDEADELTVQISQGREGVSDQPTYDVEAYRRLMNGDKDMRGVNLRGADLRKVNLDDVTFDGADLSEACFEGATLAGVLIKKSKMTKTNFKKSKLFGIQIIDCEIDETSFEESCIEEDKSGGREIPAGLFELDGIARPEDVVRVWIKNSKIKNSKFNKVHFDGVEFRDCTIESTSMREATLVDIHFRNTSLVDIDFSKAHLSSVELKEPKQTVDSRYHKSGSSAHSCAMYYKSYLGININFEGAILQNCLFLGRMRSSSDQECYRQSQINKQLGGWQFTLIPSLFVRAGHLCTSERCTIETKFKNVNFENAKLEGCSFKNIIFRNCDSLGGTGETKGTSFSNVYFISHASEMIDTFLKVKGATVNGSSLLTDYDHDLMTFNGHRGRISTACHVAPYVAYGAYSVAATGARVYAAHGERTAATPEMRTMFREFGQNFDAMQRANIRGMMNQYGGGEGF